MGLINWIRSKLGTQDVVFLRVPLEGIAGSLYVSPMPYGPYDKYNQLLKRYVQEKIEFAIPLVTDAEIARKAKRDVLDLYRKNGIEVIRFPIEDLTSPELQKVRELVKTVAPYLRAGAKVAVHCNAGVGRTAVIVACLVSKLLDLDGPEATRYITSLMHTQMTSSQKRVVEKFAQAHRDNVPV
jgi:protein-tyrosine phosphatase